jgi:protein-disulfide isomerase
MRTFIPAALVLAFCLCACARDNAGDPGSAPGLPEVAPARVAPAGAPAPAPAQQSVVYRVPVDGLPAIGDANALVTVVAFTDYQCPYCQRAEGTISQLQARYPGVLRVVVAERPLPMHPRARPAALAALAAAEQDDLEGMRARLFAGPLDDASIEQAAKDEGLRISRFDADRDGDAVGVLARSELLADQLGVHGTPTFFVNGRRVVGAQPLETFEAVVDERLASARALVAGGTRTRDVYAQTIAAGLDHVADEPEDDGACKGDGECNGQEAPPAGASVVQVPTEGAPARGPESAAITVVEFSDYECPFCVKAEPTLHALEAAHPGQVRVVFKNLPLPFHTHARLAAKAAIAADNQGRFWEMHDALFARKGTLDSASIEQLAVDLGLDMTRFDADVADPKTEARVAAEGADAAAAHVSGTPSFFVNGHRVTGAQPLSAFEAAAKSH